MNVDFCAHSPRPGNVMLASTSSAAFRRAAIFYALFLAIALGIWVRLSSVLAADFPLNDGGLFWQMAQEIRENGYALPAFTGYNFERIPFAYPPLGFYVTALVSDIFGISPLQAVRVLPALWSIAAAVAFWFLAREILRSQFAAALATLLWVLLPYTWEWFVMGGGLTRSSGKFFALLALCNAHAALRRDSHCALTWREVRAALFFGLALLCHAGQGWVSLCSLLLFAPRRDAVCFRAVERTARRRDLGNRALRWRDVSAAGSRRGAGVVAAAVAHRTARSGAAAQTLVFTAVAGRGAAAGRAQRRQFHLDSTGAAAGKRRAFRAVENA